MIPRNDSLPLGLLIGLAVPFIGFALLLQAVDWLSDEAGRSLFFRDRTLALAALCLNILPMNVFRRTYRNRALRGLVIATVVLGIVWFFLYRGELTAG